MLIGIFAYASFLVLVDRAVDMLFAQLLAWNSKPLSIFVSVVCIMQIVIAHAIFYYEFYIKREQDVLK